MCTFLIDPMRCGLCLALSDEPFKLRLPDRLNAWNHETEWGAREALPNVIEGAMASLARQLQVPRYGAIQESIRRALIE